MSGVVANGIYFNTDSGLSPMIDRLTGILDKDRQQRDQLAGIAPGLAATGVSLPQQPQGMLGGILSSLGIGGAPQQPSAAAAPQTSAPPMAAPQSAASAPNPAVNQYASYIGQAAQARGIDPMTAIRVAMSEGGMAPNRAGDGGSSFGPFQLHYGGVAPGGNSVAGLGDDFTKATGLDARDPNNWKATVDFALDNAAKNGWGAFHGAAKAGLDAYAGITRGASAYAPQSAMPGTTDAGADVAAAGLAARTAGGYPSPVGASPGVSTGAQTAAATGAAPMPIASAGQSATPTMQTGRAPGAAPAPALGAAAGVARAPLGGITNDALGAMIANPASRDLGLKLWQQKLGKGDFGFSVTPDGSVIRTDKDTGQAVLVYQAPVKHEVKDFNGRLVDFDPQSSATRDVTPAGLPQGYRPATPQEREAYGVQPGSPLFFGPDNKPGTLNSGVNQTVNTGADPIMGAVGKRFDNSLQAADTASKSIVVLRAARQQLNSPGGVFAGAFSGEKLALQKLAVAIGLPGADAEKITNTEGFNTAVGPLVLQTVKGFGAGASISNADRDAAERMVGSNKLEPDSIARAFDIQEKAALATINQHNALVEQLQQSPSGAAAYRNVGPGMRVAVPPTAAAATTKTIGGTTYHQGADGHWYTGQ